ncbi:nucleotidyl transferase family protein [Aureliella helgolandensis]|uniref:3-keto-disaccharide hydrolase domain-containing protein n=1 Tax=Aureliella helgolandensis TaxID=2527968 RepID=A0A518GA65_9BACT|nr:hypothetical protein [Aureliella helgolandensis]QDV25485.1 hypothetical protein Q31a_38110 [Aureliella helgolandensis]
MKLFLAGLYAVSLLWVPVGSALAADGVRTLIFEDDFERAESQELRDEVGQGWGTNSKSRAAGNKQVDLKEGALHIYIHEAADHAVSVTHAAEFTNGTVELRFKLEHPQDSLGLNFADPNFKPVHAGHLCMAKIGTKYVELSDLKTGVMDLKTRELRLAKQVPASLEDELKTKKRRVANELELGKWYTLSVTISGETLGASIDGKEVASFASPGIAHPTKRMLRLSVPQRVVIDDLKIYSTK